MRVIDLKHRDRPFALRECGLCLGNFDGVHRGHRALIDELKAQNAKRAKRLPLGAFLFTRPVSEVLGHPVPQLNTFEERLELLQEAGLQFAILCEFEDVKDMEPDDFVREVLMGACQCRLAVCGFNYTYGARGAGTAERLAATFGTQPDRTLSIVSPVAVGAVTVSSSTIRTMLEQGHPEEAARLLGRPFFISGTVESGKHVGTTLGFPTANLSFPKNGLIPAHGVYAATVRVGKRTYTGISNVGCRPTFDDGEHITCETFLFDYRGSLYGKALRVSLVRFLRPETKFASPEALRQQIDRDIAAAKECF